jgi:hypothetical protein
MCELSSLSGSSFSSPKVIARRRVLRRVPRVEIVVDEAREARYEDMAYFVVEWQLWFRSPLLAREEG